MNHILFEFNDQQYKLRLGAQQIVQIERKLGGNLLNMFMRIDNNEMPMLSDVLVVLHGSMQQLQHGITVEKVYEIYDKYVAAGHTYMDLIPVIIEVLQISGFFSQAQMGEKTAN